MTKQEILNAFLQAEKDWSEPIEQASENYTHWGLCAYFRIVQDMNDHIQYLHLKPLWIKYRNSFDEPYHFTSLGDEPQGRAERLEVIRKVINDLKNEIND